MRTNTRLIACYLIAMLLVNFHGNLILKAQRMSREKQPRNMMIIWKIIRDLFVAFVKLVVGSFLIFYGVIYMMLSIFFLWLCIIPIFWENGKCVMTKLVVDGAILTAAGAQQIFDVKRVLWDDAMDDDLNLIGFNRRNLEMEPRFLSQGTPTQKPNELDNLNINEFNEDTTAAIIMANAQDNFEQGRETVRQIIKMVDLKLRVRQKATCMFGTTPVDKDCTTLYKEAKDIYKQTMNVKMGLYKKRLRRIVICTAKIYMKQVDDELNPANYPADKKAEVEGLKKIAMGTDAAAKKNAEEKLKELKKKAIPTQEQQDKLSDKFSLMLIENGMNKNDAKSSYVMDLIGAVMAKISEQKTQALKNSKDAQDLLKANPIPELNLGEAEAQIKKAGKPVLPDNLANVINDVNDTDEEDPGNGTKKDQL